MEKERNSFDLKHTTSSVNYGNGMGGCMAPSGTWSLVFIDYSTADRS